MTSPEIPLTTIYRMVAFWLMIVLTGQSIFAWLRVLRKGQSRQPAMERSEEPRATWSTFPEYMVAGLVFALLAMHLALEIIPAPEVPTSVSATLLLANLVISMGLVAMLAGILVLNRPAAGFGIKCDRVLADMGIGLEGFLLALLPTEILMVATAPFRNRENQNALLTLLSDSNDLWTIAIIFAAAVVVAPLYEELVFRVILQGLLTSRVGPGTAIPLTAAAFAAIHGVTDAAALLPLALILGYVFDRRHSYLSVLVIHGMFNATMLTLALLTGASAD